MKRILYVGALSLLLFGSRGTDIESLRPVELVQLTEQNGVLVLETDMGDCGWGPTVERAVAKLKETTPGRIYLDTANYLLLGEGMEECLPQLREYLKKGTRMTYVQGRMNLEDVAEYLRIHHPSRAIEGWSRPAEKLVLEGGKPSLKKFQEI